MGKFEGTLRNTTIAFNGLMVIGFLGIVWLMIYGNLSGNLGFPSVSTYFTNETINLTDAGNTPASAQNRVGGSLAEVLVTNTTGGELIVSGANYTLTGLVFSSLTTDYNGSYVNISGIVSYDSNADISSEDVIRNLTQGANTFFTFSNTLFTIIAIVLLITLLLALLYIVMGIVKMSKGGGGGFAE